MTKTNKIMVVGTIDVIIDTADAFLMLHPQATLQDFITFLEKTRASYKGRVNCNEKFIY